MAIETQNDEMRSMRTVQRELSGIVSELEDGGLEKCVVTKHGRMVAVLLPLKSYEKLTEAPGQC